MPLTNVVELISHFVFQSGGQQNSKLIAFSKQVQTLLCNYCFLFAPLYTFAYPSTHCIIWAPLYTFVYTNVHPLCRSLYTSLCILLPFCILCTTPWRKITSDHFMKTCHNFFPPRNNHKRESPTDIVRLKHFPAVTITLCYTETCIINMLLLLTVSSFTPC